MRGRAHRFLGQNDLARTAFEQAIAVVEQLRKKLKFDDYRYALLADKRAPYEALFTLHAQAGRVMEALEISERARARAFLDAYLTFEPDNASSRPVPSAPSARLLALQKLAPALTASAISQPQPIDAVLEALGDLNVIVFFKAEGHLWRYSRTAGQPRLTELPASMVDISKQARRVASFAREPIRYDTLGKTLLTDALGPAGPVYIVTDDILGRIPFAALRLGGRYLIESHVVSYVPSLSALAQMLRGAGGSRGEPVVLGAPAAPGGDKSGRPALLAARVEAHHVAEHLNVSPTLGSAANRQAFRDAASASVLHIASHAALESGGTHLQLADGRIYPSTILDWQVRPDIVVLATCASAARPSHGVWGTLAGAFLAAGTKTAIAALSTISDEAAARFVADLYPAGGATTPAHALAKVQRRWLADGRGPEQWATYVALGVIEPGEVTNEPRAR